MRALNRLVCSRTGHLRKTDQRILHGEVVVGTPLVGREEAAGNAPTKLVSVQSQSDLLEVG